MDLAAKLAFRKVYPFIANHVVNKYRVTSGMCLDVGSGPGSLSIAIAEITNLTLIALDVSPEMAEIARGNFNHERLSPRIEPIVADVHRMPYQNDSFSLIVSRGSIFFWNDRPQALKEIYRILKPGGIAFCGGGMGTDEIRREANSIIMTNYAFSEDFREFWCNRNKGHDRNEEEIQFKNDLKNASLVARLIRDCSGIWVEMVNTRPRFCSLL